MIGVGERVLSVRHRFNAYLALSATLFAALLGPAAVQADTISYSDLLARKAPVPTKQLAYGGDPEQFGELWLPEGQGPFPVAVLIHGGCWQAALPGTVLMAYIAEDLRKSGFAVWNIEYRRLGSEGAGYPGTFLDVAQAMDYLRDIAADNHLDLGTVIVAGHSAGGHLALWAAGRGQLEAGGPLWRHNPLPVKAAVALAGINDLKAYRQDGPSACGGPGTIDALVDAAGRQGLDLYKDTSPAAMLPLKVPQLIVSGVLDPIVPDKFGRDYAAQAMKAGDPVEMLDIEGAGHFELIDPESEAWKKIKADFLAYAHPK